MDLKFKSPKWVGSIYHTFEAICHEVDDFVSQETVKYVENQAQAVGGSVKRFCSNVVQDLLPSSLIQPGKHEPLVLSLEHKEKDGTYISGLEIKDLEHEKSDIFLGENDPNKGQMDKTSDIFEESELKEEWMNTNGNIVEANDPKTEPSWPKENEEWIKTEAKNVEESDPKRAPYLPKEKEEWTNTNTNNVEENHPKEEPSQLKEMDLFYPEKASLLSDTKIEVTCDTYICHTEHNSDLSKSPSASEMNFSVMSVDNKMVESELASCSSHLSSEMVDVPHSEENICYCLVNEIDDTDMKLALSSSTFDEDVPSADEIAALVASFEDNPCKDYAHLEALMSFLKVDEEDDCMVDIKDPSMVTIELSDDKAKLDENCVHKENKLLYAVFCRSRKHKSFKKILQDAFASRKRLRKEYEQLGILFGDINIDPPTQQHGNNLLPEITSSSLGSKTISSGDLSEWELL